VLDRPRLSPDPDLVGYHLYAQWACSQQLEQRSGAGLYLDVPVGVHPSGFDTWWSPESFALNVSGGAPPDDFFSGGQTWGFPPLHPERERERGYSYTIDYLRTVMSHASIIRVDHVMGLHRLYWVPDGFDARDGAYVRYQGDELHALLVLEASRSDTAVAGEDLGTVPGSVRKALSRDGMLSSFVVQFESSATQPLPAPKENVLASFGTHDLPTFCGFWEGTDIRYQETAGFIDEEEADSKLRERAEWRTALCGELGVTYDEPAELRTDETVMRQVLSGILTNLGTTQARLVQVDLEDLWLEPEQQNRPGTFGPDTSNFSRRSSRTFEEFTTDPYVIELTRALSDARNEGRDER
jgi:4-alpha-glucanotransferase